MNPRKIVRMACARGSLLKALLSCNLFSIPSLLKGRGQYRLHGHGLQAWFIDH